LPKPEELIRGFSIAALILLASAISLLLRSNLSTQLATDVQERKLAGDCAVRWPQERGGAMRRGFLSVFLLFGCVHGYRGCIMPCVAVLLCRRGKSSIALCLPCGSDSARRVVRWLWLRVLIY